MSSNRAFSRHLAIAYLVLLVYACLYPMDTWRSSGLPRFGYLTAPWPKYYTTDDTILNILGYTPLGLTVVASLPLGWTRRRRIIVTVVFAALLSFCMETLQNFLPTRVASNIDLTVNSFGALLGALAGAHWGQALFAPGRGLARWRERYITDGLTGDVGLILIMLWLLVQLTPNHMLFPGGEWRKMLGITPPLPFAAGRLIAFETAQTASMLVAVGLFARCTLHISGKTLVFALFTLGIGARMLASGYLLVPANPLAWVTPGAGYGLLIGAGLLVLALYLPRVAQHALAGTTLLMASMLINMMPESPYVLSSGPPVVRSGNYLNFYGLCRLVAALWPFAALAYLSVLGLWRGEHLEEKPAVREST